MYKDQFEPYLADLEHLVNDKICLDLPTTTNTNKTILHGTAGFIYALIVVVEGLKKSQLKHERIEVMMEVLYDHITIAATEMTRYHAANRTDFIVSQTKSSGNVTV